VSRRVRVAVLLGGRSSEHEISLASARSVLDALDPERYETVTVEIGRDGRWELGTGDGGSVAETLPVPPRMFPRPSATSTSSSRCCMAPSARTGRCRGLLELAGVPYVGAGVLGSALAMDKDVFKAGHARPRHPGHAQHHPRQGQGPENPFGYPVFVKPAASAPRSGSRRRTRTRSSPPRSSSPSGTTTRCSSRSSSDGVEVECGVLGNDRPIASLPGEIVSHGFGGADWYDYSAKYDEGGMDLLIPPRLDQETVERVQGACGSVVRRRRVRGHGAGRLLRPRRTATCSERAEHDPGLHRDERLRQAVRGLGGCPTRSWSTGSCSSRSERHERRSRLQY
jgi:D-alanine-D-alanine ligase